MIDHDITHCKGDGCPLRESCFRYLMHLDLQASKGKYGTLHSYLITSPHNYGKCKMYLKTKEDNQ